MVIVRILTGALTIAAVIVGLAVIAGAGLIAGIALALAVIG